MDAFVTKRPRTPTDDADGPAKKPSNKLAPKVTKPKEHEFVGAGAIERLDTSTLTVALDAESTGYNPTADPWARD